MRPGIAAELLAEGVIALVQSLYRARWRTKIKRRSIIQKEDTETLPCPGVEVLPEILTPNAERALQNHTRIDHHGKRYRTEQSSRQAVITAAGKRGTSRQFASTTPRGLPARGPRSAPGSDTNPLPHYERGDDLPEYVRVRFIARLIVTLAVETLWREVLARMHGCEAAAVACIREAAQRMRRVVRIGLCAIAVG